MSRVTIVCDPPWKYNSRISRGPGTRTRFGNGAEGHYPLMPDADLLALAPSMKQLAGPEAIMFMWATGPRLPFAIELLKAWGFRYATIGFTWVKTNKGGSYFAGPGYYTGSNAELVLVGVRGSMPPHVKMLNQVIETQDTLFEQDDQYLFEIDSDTLISVRGAHSQKPPDVLERIERMYPDAEKFEIFCREPRPGWVALGNEVGGLDIADELAIVAEAVENARGT